MVCRGKPCKLFSDQGTNFHGGEKELQEAFTSLSPKLQQHLAKQKISFHFNPPNAPHFGGAWEREIRSVKTALRITIGSQTVTEEVLLTVLIEVEGILNSRLLGYTSSNIADFDPVMPNYLLKGRPDSSLPPVLYPNTEVIGAYRDGGKARCLQISSGQALLDTTCQHSRFVTNGTQM